MNKKSILLLFISIACILNYSCDKKDVKITSINELKKYRKLKIDLNNHSKKLIDFILQEDVTNLAVHFDYLVRITELEYGPEFLRSRDYDGFIKKKGNLYYLFFDTKKLNKSNLFLEKNSLCIRESILSPSCNAIYNLDKNTIGILLFGKYKYYYEIYMNETGKIDTIMRTKVHTKEPLL